MPPPPHLNLDMVNESNINFQYVACDLKSILIFTIVLIGIRYGILVFNHRYFFYYIMNFFYLYTSFGCGGSVFVFVLVCITLRPY